MRRLQRPCLECGRPTRFGPRCEAHALPVDRKAPRDMRGYGADHKRARRQLELQLARAGTVPCGYCHQPIHDGARWDAAHVIDGSPEYGYMISHPRCNQRAKGTT